MESLYSSRTFNKYHDLRTVWSGQYSIERTVARENLIFQVGQIFLNKIVHAPRIAESVTQAHKQGGDRKTGQTWRKLSAGGGTVEEIKGKL